jgi:hypothetical protein
MDRPKIEVGDVFRRYFRRYGAAFVCNMALRCRARSAA